MNHTILHPRNCKYTEIQVLGQIKKLECKLRGVTLGRANLGGYVM